MDGWGECLSCKNQKSSSAIADAALALDTNLVARVLAGEAPVQSHPAEKAVLGAIQGLKAQLIKENSLSSQVQPW